MGGRWIPRATKREPRVHMTIVSVENLARRNSGDSVCGNAHWFMHTRTQGKHAGSKTRMAFGGPIVSIAHFAKIDLHLRCKSCMNLAGWRLRQRDAIAEAELLWMCVEGMLNTLYVAFEDRGYRWSTMLDQVIPDV